MSEAKEKIDKIIAEEIISQLNSIALNYDGYEYGLPMDELSNEYKEMVQTVVDIIHNRDLQNASARAESSPLEIVGQAEQWKIVEKDGYPNVLETMIVTYRGTDGALHVSTAFYGENEDGWHDVDSDEDGEYPIYKVPVIAYRPLPDPYRPARLQQEKG